MDPCVTYKGTLKKRSSFFGMWASCYCEVKGEELIIYRNTDSKVIDKKIHLSSDIIAMPVEEDPTKFVIESATCSAITFMTESEEQAMAWILAVKSACINDRTTTMDDFKIISVLGRGYYGKVMLVQLKGSALSNRARCISS